MGSCFPDLNCDVGAGFEGVVCGGLESSFFCCSVLFPLLSEVVFKVGSSKDIIGVFLDGNPGKGSGSVDILGTSLGSPKPCPLPPALSALGPFCPFSSRSDFLSC